MIVRRPEFLPMRASDPAALLRQYEGGRITDGELLLRLVQAAAERPPSEVAPVLPAPLLARVCRASASPPASPEDSPRIAYAGSWVGPHDHEAEERRQRRLWYDGAWRWHRFFRGDA
jgi:hypothetical protein